MALIGISIVKNECDIIETMARHNLAYLDKIHFVDNGSSDNTKQILEHLRAEGLSIQISEDKRIGHLQRHYFNQLTNDKYKHDNVVLLDADEFLRPMNGKSVASLFEDDVPKMMPWMNYLPSPNDDPEAIFIPKRVQYRRQSENPQYYKVVVPAGLERPVNIAPGSHNLIGVEGKIQTDVILAHFPIRTLEQLIGKVLIGAWNTRMRPHGRGENAHWRRIAMQITQGHMPSEKDLPRLAALYTSLVDNVEEQLILTRDPLISEVREIRYTPKRPRPLLQNLIDYTEQLVRAQQYRRKESAE